MLEILNLIHNKKGASYLGLIASLFVSIAIIIIASNFNVYVSNQTDKVNKHNDLSQEIMNEVAHVYNVQDWETLESKVVETEYGNMEIEYEFQEETEFKTDKLELIFKINANQERYSLERSVYYE